MEVRLIATALGAIVVLWILFSLFRSIPQATVAVVTVFGKYRRIMREGPTSSCPGKQFSYRLSLQNRALQMEFQAITQDQANVKFATMVAVRRRQRRGRSDQEGGLQLRLAAGVPARAAAHDRRLDPAVRRHHQAGRHPRHARRDRRAHQEEPRRGGAPPGATSCATSRSPT